MYEKGIQCVVGGTHTPPLIFDARSTAMRYESVTEKLKIKASS